MLVNAHNATWRCESKRATTVSADISESMAASEAEYLYKFHARSRSLSLIRKLSNSTPKYVIKLPRCRETLTPNSNSEFLLSDISTRLLCRIVVVSMSVQSVTSKAFESHLKFAWGSLRLTVSVHSHITPLIVSKSGRCRVRFWSMYSISHAYYNESISPASLIVAP